MHTTTPSPEAPEHPAPMRRTWLRTPFALEVSRALPAPVDRVWAAIADVGGYARFADGIAATQVVSGAGEVRRCTDDAGRGWSETCTLWEEGHRYRMSVDVDSYPLRYRAVLASLEQAWEVAAVPTGTHVALTFVGVARLGAVGRLAVTAMARGDRLERILDAYEHHLR